MSWGFQRRGSASRFTEDYLHVYLQIGQRTYIHRYHRTSSGVLELETHLRRALWTRAADTPSPVPVAVDKALGASAQSLMSRPNSGYSSLVATPRITAERKEECPGGEWPHPGHPAPTPTPSSCSPSCQDNPPASSDSLNPHPTLWRSQTKLPWNLFPTLSSGSRLLRMEMHICVYAAPAAQLTALAWPPALATW